jgi:hypothetical protein
VEPGDDVSIDTDEGEFVVESASAADLSRDLRASIWQRGSVDLAVAKGAGSHGALVPAEDPGDGWFAASVWLAAPWDETGVSFVLVTSDATGRTSAMRTASANGPSSRSCTPF